MLNYLNIHRSRLRPLSPLSGWDLTDTLFSTMITSDGDLFFFFSLKWTSISSHQFHFLGQDQSKVVQRAETTVAECFPTSYVWAHFPDRFPHCAWKAWSAHSNFVVSKMDGCLGVTCLPQFWQNDRGPLRAILVTRGRKGHHLRVSTES